MRVNRRQFLVLLGLAPFIPKLKLKAKGAPAASYSRTYTNRNGWRIVDIDMRDAHSPERIAHMKQLLGKRASQEIYARWV